MCERQAVSWKPPELARYTSLMPPVPDRALRPLDRAPNPGGSEIEKGRVSAHHGTFWSLAWRGIHRRPSFGSDYLAGPRPMARRQAAICPR